MKCTIRGIDAEGDPFEETFIENDFDDASGTAQGFVDEYGLKDWKCVGENGETILEAENARS